MIGRENILKPLAGPKVRKLLPRIERSSDSEEMTLLTDAVPSNRLKLRRVDDRTRAGILEMFFPRPMTTFTRNRLRCAGWGAVLIPCAGYRQCGSGMAEQAPFGYRPSEIRIGQSFVAGCQIIRFATLVICDRRLKQMACQVEQIAGSVIARS